MPDSPVMLTVTVDPHNPDRALLLPAADALLAGGLVAFPTETVYGLGALALDPVAAGRIFDAKGRPADDPLIVHVRPHWDLGGVFAEVNATISDLARLHWPGPLTIVAAKHPSVPDVVTAGRSTVAVRAPSHPVAMMLLDMVGVPVAAPSANRFSYVSPTSAAHVAADLGDRIEVLVDGGPTPIGIESTIVLVEGERLSILRPGSIQLDGVEADLSAPASHAPGRRNVHYSPNTPTRALEAGGRLPPDTRSGTLVGFDDSEPGPPGWRFVSLGDRDDLAIVAQRLYETLREIDRTDPEQIVVEFTGRGGLGEAVDDRIRRAAGGQTVY
ncbi:MAG: L-threonylcarbamoyladenylate synthase [Acidimicrobiia bacterium]